MALREKIEGQGNWLFRMRSYLPLAGLPLLLLALRQSGAVGRAFGERAQGLWEIFSILIAFLGLVVRCLIVGYVPRGTSGRNTKGQVAEALNTSGMYSVVRNPLYLSNAIIIFGVTLFVQVWWFALIVWTGFWLYYERIIFAEEEFLRRKFGDLFLEWADMTPAFFPNFRNWRKPELPFSLKTVLKREFSTFFSIVATFFFLKVGAALLAKGKPDVHIFWVIFFLAGFAIYWTFFLLKKKTSLLVDPGR